jgi:hypothetical protein
MGEKFIANQFYRKSIFEKGDGIKLLKILNLNYSRLNLFYNYFKIQWVNLIFINIILFKKRLWDEIYNNLFYWNRGSKNILKLLIKLIENWCQNWFKNDYL